MSLVALSNLLGATRNGDHPVATRQGEIIRYAQFRADVAAVAAACKPVQTTLNCSDSYDFAVALFAVLHAGGIAVLPTNCQLAEPSCALIDDASIIDLLQHAPMALKPLDASREAIHFYTSGSTGEPKKIAKSLHMLETELQVLDNMWGGAKGPVLSTVPHHHLYGLTFSLLWPLAHGFAFDSGMHHFWESLFAQATPETIIISSPAHLERLGGIAPLHAAKRPARVFSAGAPLPFAASQQALAVMGCLPTEIFGSTETGAIATRQQRVDDAVWQLLPGISMQCDEQRRLVIQSPFMGANAFTTDDMVEPSGEGFRFLGRFDRMVKISGKRVHLSHVEQRLQALPWVAQVAATTMLQGNRLELIAAVVLSEEGRAAAAQTTAFAFRQQLRQAMGKTCEPTSIPRRWRFVDALPGNALGKRRDSDILALFSEVA